jgi:hypothetical protein
MKRDIIIKRVLLGEGNTDNLDWVNKLPPDDRQKIIDGIGSLDRLIELYSEKLNLLKKHRLGLVQKLNPDFNERIIPHKIN